MDIEIKGSLEAVAEVLRGIGFKVVFNKNKIEAKLKKGWGRYHILGITASSESIYLDVHWDAPFHFIFLGVDYGRRPRTICNEILVRANKKGLKSEVKGGTDWFSRRNKAIFRGIKI